MKLLPLRPVAPRPICHNGETDLAANCRVACLKTGERSPAWNEAAAAGWVFDAEGEPFASYYSPATAATITPEEAATLAAQARQTRIFSSP